MSSRPKIDQVTTQIEHDTVVDNAPTGVRTGKLRRPGFVDGRYELLSMISKGGMGRVFKARHRDLGKDVAIKLVLDSYKESSYFREMFFREARVASSLTHPGVVSVTDFGLDEDLGYFVVMELLEGETLEQWLRNNPKLKRRLEIFDQAVEAVRYIHRRGIVHCDLKPANIFITKTVNGLRTKLLDFGLSWRKETVPDEGLSGTPLYMAPERLSGAPPSPSCDVYSLGVVLYELVTGIVPYTGNPVQLCAKKLFGAAPRLPSTCALEAVDPRIDQIIMKALATEPEVRHVSVEAFHYELRTFMNMMGFTTGTKKGRRDK